MEKKVRTHLTLTGFHAGKTLCGAPREAGSNSVHAVFAPLNNAAFRAAVCETCLSEFIASYEADEDLPSWAGDVKHFSLQHQTPEMIRATLEARDRIDMEQRKEDALAARKAEADAMLDSFTLTGSNRAADDPNQQHLF